MEGASSRALCLEEARCPDFCGCMTSLSSTMLDEKLLSASDRLSSGAPRGPLQSKVTSSTRPRGVTDSAMACALCSARSVSTISSELAWPHPAMFPCQATTRSDVVLNAASVLGCR
eukprot:3770956-Pyramimonas_sp.AAC.1